MEKTPIPSYRIRIVTDTTATLPSEFVRAHDIQVVPQIVVFGQKTYFENVTLSFDEFLGLLKSSPMLPKTSAPQPGDMIEAYRCQLEHADTIISLHPSIDVSGTVRSALTAKNTTFPDADIRIIDSRTAGGNLASIVIAATEWAEHGIGADEIIQRVNAMIPRGRVYFLVATLEYLQKGGRIGGASALIGTALQIKPILELKNGRVEAFEKVRTHHRALERIKELALEQCPRSEDAHLCVMQADAEDVAQKLVADLQSELGIKDIPIYPCGASITTHVGPGTLAVAFFV